MYTCRGLPGEGEGARDGETINLANVERVRGTTIDDD